MNKLLIICGPTATGKTSLGIYLAKNFNGEIVSADSRQVYRGMDIGTGKDLPVSSEFIDRSSQLRFNSDKLRIGFRKKDEIPIWLLDVCKPDYRFNVGEYKKLASLVISDIWQRGKLPIVVGGTGLYIKAITQPLDRIIVPPNESLRKALEVLSSGQLQHGLQSVDQQKFWAMNESDQQNPRRLIRAIEIAIYASQTKTRVQLVKQSQRHRQVKNTPQDILIIGLTASLGQIYRRVNDRVDKRITLGVIEEIGKLLRSQYTWELPAMSALGYAEWRTYFEKLKGKQSALVDLNQIKDEAIKQWKLHERQFAKRQLTWFKKNRDIEWFDIADVKIRQHVKARVKKWYNFRQI